MTKVIGRAPFIAAEVDLRDAKVKGAHATGPSLDERHCSNRMPDATVDLMSAK